MRTRTPGSVLLLQAWFLAADAFGAPVLADETSPAPLEFAGELSRSDPATAAPQHGGASTPTDGSRSIVTPASRHSPAIAADAEPTQERPRGEVHEAALGPGREIPPPRPQVGAISMAPGLSFDDAIDPDLKEAAKAALRWTHEVREWLQPARLGATDGAFQESESRSAPAVDATRFQGSVQSNPGSRMAYQPAFQQAHPSGQAAGGENNLIRAGINLIKEVVWHPLSWLLMALLAIGGMSVLIAQHRARVHRRRFRVDATRGQRRSSKTSRGAAQRTSGSTAGIPPAALSSGKTRVRTTTRRTGQQRQII